VLAFTDSRGKRRRVSLSTDRRVAERLQIELIRQRDLELAGLAPIEGMSTPLEDLRDQYLLDLAVRAGAKQVRSRKDSLERVLAALEATRVRDLRVVDLQRYQRERLAQGVANRTVNVDTGALAALLSWAVGAQIIAENPIKTLKPLPTTERHQRRVRRALSDDEIERLLVAAAEDDAECADRGRARVPQLPLWRALLETAARWGELTSVTWLDLDADALALTLRGEHTKAARSRVIPVSAALADELLALREVHQRVRMRLVRPGDRIFLSASGADWAAYTTNARRLLRRVMDRAGIARRDALGRVVDIHGLRHTAATRMARRGVPLVVAQRVLGHSDPKLTARAYTHLEAADLRVAVEGVSKPRRGRGATA